jgi:predicted house-cleaning noncanonical NTP pyrophosphatase (MazG superfamily)
MTTYNKLVRDKIPEIIRASGRRPVVTQLGPDEMREALLAKLDEEADELRAAAPDEAPAELADLLEVVRALAAEHGVPWDQVLGVAHRKALERGGFAKRTLLHRIE